LSNALKQLKSCVYTQCFTG